MKFQEAYLAALYDVLEKGGKQDAVDRAISEVNNPTPTGLVAWLKAYPSQPCGACGATYTPENVTLDQEMLCPSCKSPS